MDSQGASRIIEEFVSTCIKIVIIIGITSALLGGTVTYFITKNINQKAAQEESTYDNR